MARQWMTPLGFVIDEDGEDEYMLPVGFVMNEDQAAAPAGGGPKGPFKHPFIGAFGGPV